MKWPRITPSALDDARSALEKLVASNPALGEQFADALADAFEQIAAHPRQSARLETNRTDQGVRRFILSRFKRLVIYKMVGDAPVIVAIPHAGQHPDLWLTRDEDA